MINSVVIMGRLTQVPELKATQSGLSVLPFSIACDRQYNREETDFIDCVAWRQTAEFISRYFTKGDMIAIGGSLKAENYIDKNGNNRKRVTVTVSDVSFCGKKRGQGAQYFEQPSPSHPNYRPDIEEVDTDDDLPF